MTKYKKLNADQLEKHFIKAFQLLDNTKEACKVTISQCTQVPDINVTNAAMRSSMETMDTCDLCKFFIVNRSPNTKKMIRLTMTVIETTEKQCDRLKDDKYCKDTMRYCSKVCHNTNDELKTIYYGI